MPETAVQSSCVPPCLLLDVCKLLGDRNLELAVSQLMGTQLTVTGGRQLILNTGLQMGIWEGEACRGPPALDQPSSLPAPASPAPAGGLGDSSIYREEEAAEWRVICQARQTWRAWEIREAV